MGDLADSLVLDPSALVHNLKPLLRDGFVAVTIDDEDRRARRVNLTPLGAEKLKEATKLWENAQKRFKKVYGAEDAASLLTALSIVASLDFDAS